MIDAHDPLIGPRIKLRRAAHHVNELSSMEADYFAKNSGKIITVAGDKPGHKIVKIVMDAKPPEDIHVLVGEIIYQLRSALDQTAVAFARLSKKQPNPKSVYYPTGDSLKGFRKSCLHFDDKGRAAGNLLGFDADLRKAILRTRAYDGGNDNLRAIFRLANIDKHMELIAISIGGGLGDLDGFSINKGQIFVGPPGNLSAGVAFAELFPGGSIERSRPDSNITMSGRICLGGGSAYDGRQLVPLIKAMLSAGTQAHDLFVRVLTDRGDLPPPTDFMTAGAGWHTRDTAKHADSP